MNALEPGAVASLGHPARRPRRRLRAAGCPRPRAAAPPDVHRSRDGAGASGCAGGIEVRRVESFDDFVIAARARAVVRELDRGGARAPARGPARDVRTRSAASGPAAIGWRFIDGRAVASAGAIACSAGLYPLRRGDTSGRARPRLLPRTDPRALGRGGAPRHAGARRPCAGDVAADPRVRRLRAGLHDLRARERPAGRVVTEQRRIAAVLVPVFRDAAGLLRLVLIVRTDRGLHGGQLAVPGGKVDPGDESLLATALRETEEEIGLAPEQVERPRRARHRAQRPDGLRGAALPGAHPAWASNGDRTPTRSSRC